MYKGWTRQSCVINLLRAGQCRQRTGGSRQVPGRFQASTRIELQSKLFMSEVHMSHVPICPRPRNNLLPHPILVTRLHNSLPPPKPILNRNKDHEWTLTNGHGKCEGGLFWIVYPGKSDIHVQGMWVLKVGLLQLLIGTKAFGGQVVQVKFLW